MSNNEKTSKNLSAPTTISSTQPEILCGGFTPFRPLDAEDSVLFQDVYKYDPPLEPFEVSTQVVAGINYRFRCKGKSGIFVVTIYQPLPGNGDPSVTSVDQE